MSTMTDADIHAFTEAGPPHGPEGRGATHPPRRWWPWVLLSLCVLFVAAVVAGVLVLGETLDLALGGLDIRVDGERVLSVPRGEAAWWAVSAGLLAGMVMLVVVPLSLLLALLITTLVLATVVVVALAVGALALSPLWVLALLLWLALREPRRNRAAASPASAAAQRAGTPKA